MNTHSSASPYYYLLFIGPHIIYYIVLAAAVLAVMYAIINSISYRRTPRVVSTGPSPCILFGAPIFIPLCLRGAGEGDKSVE